MAARKRSRLIVADLRGGRNDTDPPMALPANQCVDALNVDWKDATLARKRGGADAVALTGGTAFDTAVVMLIRHVPGGDETLAELWGIDRNGATVLVKRLTGGTSWADVTLSDAIAVATGYDVVGATLNGKLFLAHDSAVDRLHVYDPNLGTPRVRRVGFATPAAPTAADTGAGAYAAVLRYYRVRWLQLNGTTVARRSEAGASVSFTPSGTGTAARVTQPAVASEQETHWEVEASTDNAAFFRLSQVAIATTTYDDSAATTTYANNTASAQAGAHTRPTSWRYILADGNRLLGAGAFETSGARNSRVWFTPVLGSADQGDDERIPDTTTQKNWVDLNENDGGFITGLGGPINGVPYVFKYRQVWRLRPTGDVAAPYLPRKIRDDIGAVTHRSIAVGEDQLGRPALYFMSHRGPYRITADGEVEYLGRDNEVMWRSMNLGTNAIPTVTSISLFYPDLHQWWVWIATTSTVPTVKMMFDVQRGFPDGHGQIRGGWARHTGLTAAAYSACLFSNTLGAAMSRDLKPHMSVNSGALQVLKCDTTTTNDAGTNFQSFVLTRPMVTGEELGQKVRLDEVYLLAAVQSGVTITLTVDRDFAAETRTFTTVLSAAGTETRTLEKFENSGMGEADVIQLQVGDSAAASNTWTLDALIVPRTFQEDR